MSTVAAALQFAIERHRTGQFPEAERALRQILAADPQHADAWHLLGVIAHQVGQHAAAIDCFSKAVDFDPQAAIYHNSLGAAYRAMGQLDDAARCYRRALDRRPELPGIHKNLGNVFMEQGNFAAAEACYRQALELSPDSAEAHSKLGDALAERERLEDAARCYRSALELTPDDVETLNKLGNAHAQLDQHAAAVECYRRLLEFMPDSAEVLSNLGNVLTQQGEINGALACYRRALELRPDWAELHNNLGTALKKQGSLAAAEASCRRALELNPEFAVAHFTLANCLKEQARFDEAAESYDRALELDPKDRDAHFGRSLLWLLRGDFQRGWADYQWRNRMKNLVAVCDPRHVLWDGRRFPGKTILIQFEQGLGDTLQFIRYVPLVKERGGTVVVGCQPELFRLLASVQGIDRLVVPGGEPLADFDLYVPLMSLPGIFGTTLESVPAEVPYLHPEPAQVERWKQTLAGSAEFKVGVVWQGSAENTRDHLRSFPAICLAPLARVPGTRLYSLQKGPGRLQLVDARQAFDIVDLADELADFSETAAAMKCLDLVISCDTSPAHLAGALGVPVWVPLAFVADWRYLLDRLDSPWYPNMRLFRQRERGNWREVFERVAAALRETVGSAT
jgi:tetratricopeptide (TPR) repeat protein